MTRAHLAVKEFRRLMRFRFAGHVEISKMELPWRDSVLKLKAVEKRVEREERPVLELESVGIWVLPLFDETTALS